MAPFIVTVVMHWWYFMRKWLMFLSDVSRS